MNESNYGNFLKQTHTVFPQDRVVAVQVSHSWRFLLLYFGIMAGRPSRSPPASRRSTAAAAVAAPNQSAALNELVAPVQPCSAHLSNLRLLQRCFFPF